MTNEFVSSIREQETKPTHHCGIGMVYSQASSVNIEQVIKIGHALQHRGQNGAGFAASSNGMLRRSVGEGLLEDALPDEKLEKFNSSNTWTMIHMRYGTQGGYNYGNIQPLEVWTNDARQIAVAVNGNMPFAQDLRSQLVFDLPEDASDTYIASQILARTDGETWDERIQNFADIPEVRHSANNMFVGVGDDMYVIRDEYGMHPLVMGETQEGDIAVVSETVALQKINGKVIGEFPRGAILKLGKDGHEWIRKGTVEKKNRCIFEPAYFMSPNSTFPIREDSYDSMSPEQWLDVMSFRMKCGKIVAEECPPPEVDFVVGMPDSGVPFAQGMANALGLDYVPSMIRSHYNGDEATRTFMQDIHINGIPSLVKGKLMPVNNSDIWRGKRILIGDDSLVRGNTALAINEMLRTLGVAEIHWRLGFPMVMDPCELGVSFRSKEELLAAQCNGDWELIAKAIGADSVGFISNEGIIKAAQKMDESVVIPENLQDIFFANGWCGACVTGKSPMILHERKVN